MQTIKNHKSLFSLLLKTYAAIFLLVGMVALLAVTSCAPLEVADSGTDTNEPDSTGSNQSNADWLAQSNTEWTTSNDAWIEQSNQSNNEWTTSNDAWIEQSNTDWLAQSNTDWLAQSNTDWLAQSNTDWLAQSNTDWLAQSNTDWLAQSNTDWLAQSNTDWLAQSNTDWINSRTAADVSKENCEHADLSLNCFISVWDTSQPAVGAITTDKTIVLPLIKSTSTNVGEYDFYVDWGDGTVEHITDFNAIHTYATDGEYTVYIAGTIDGFGFGENVSSTKRLIDITQWGSLILGGTSGLQFRNTINFVGTATDAPDVSKTKTLTYAFEGASKFNGVVNDWDVSQVTNMENMFKDTEEFNQPLAGWDVSQVLTMRSMFYNAEAFDQDISGWTIHPNLNYAGFYIFSIISAENRHIGIIE